MARVELHTSVGRLENRPLVRWARRAIRCNIGLQPAEQGCRRCRVGWPIVQIGCIRSCGSEGELKFGYVATQVGEQPMINEAVGGVVGTSPIDEQACWACYVR